MPELPEVETVLRGIRPILIKKTVEKIIVRQPKLRWPIPAKLASYLKHQVLRDVFRRGKYLLFQFDTGILLIHLGMSGRLCVLAQPCSAKKHDHMDIIFSNNIHLRYTDPRKFGAILWIKNNWQAHPLLAHLGIEPLLKSFTGKYLWEKAQGRKVSIKTFLMNAHIVTGIGNIYATESLFEAGILPQTPAGKLSLSNYNKLAKACKKVLRKAILKGGTTLKDYRQSDGTQGHFHLDIQIYGKAKQPCPRCKTILKTDRIGQRSSVYCPKCQR